MGGEVWWWCEKLDVESSYDPIIQLLSIFPEELKTGNSSKYIQMCNPAALFPTAKRRKSPDRSATAEWTLQTKR